MSISSLPQPINSPGVAGFSTDLVSDRALDGPGGSDGASGASGDIDALTARYLRDYPKLAPADAGTIASLVARALANESISFEQLVQSFFSLYKKLQITAQLSATDMMFKQFFAAVQAAQEALLSARLSGGMTLAFSGVGVVAGAGVLGAKGASWLKQQFSKAHEKAAASKGINGGNATVPVIDPSPRARFSRSSSQGSSSLERQSGGSSSHDGFHDSPRGRSNDRSRAGPDDRLGDRFDDDSSVAGSTRSSKYGGSPPPSVPPSRQNSWRGLDDDDGVLPADPSAARRSPANNAAKADKVDGDTAANSTGQPVAGTPDVNKSGLQHMTQQEVTSILSGLLMFALPNAGQGAGQLAGALPQAHSEELKALSQLLGQIYQMMAESRSASEDGFRQLAQAYAAN